MKKIFSLAAAIVMAVSAFGAERANTLKVYNWADYINQDVLNAFPDWYKAQTGEEVNVIYQTFDINESMLTQIEVGKEDYDVVCPSEYIIERMLRNNLLLKIDKNFGSTPDYTTLVSPYVVDVFQQMAPVGTDIQVSDYTVGYMGGTTGLLYNPALLEKAGLTEEDIQSWGILQNPKLKDKILMKDAYRDVYSCIIQYCHKDELDSLNAIDPELAAALRRELVGTITDDGIAKVEKFLKAMEPNIAGWEVDFGKEEMAKGNEHFVMDLLWSGDAQWAIDEAAEVGIELKYVVPQEGSNVWFDGWVIPKYAQNVKAASYFINYMCMPENAMANMDEIGYVSVIADTTILNQFADDEENWEETADLRYYFGEDAEAVHANPVFYPDQSVIDRCALMHDCGDKTEQMQAMWNRVKGDNLSTHMVIFLAIAGVVVVAAVAYIFLSKRKRNKRRR